jgi:hypothetical protein
LELVLFGHLVGLGGGKERYGTDFEVKSDQFGSGTAALALGQVVLVLKFVVGGPQFEEHVEVVDPVVVALAGDFVFVALDFLEYLETEDLGAVSEHVARQHQQDHHDLNVVQRRQRLCVGLAQQDVSLHHVDRADLNAKQDQKKVHHLELL